MPEGAHIKVVLDWIWGCQTQLERFALSVDSELQILSDEETTDRARRQAWALTRFDQHLLLVAANNLAKAMTKYPDVASEIDELPDPNGALELLRNVHEHWDETRDAFRGEAPMRRSGKRFSESFPGASPWSMVFPMHGGIEISVVDDESGRRPVV